MCVGRYALEPARAGNVFVMGPLVIDVEASGLGRGSYPIEVGIVKPNGETFCTIIRPPPEWQHWDAAAEALHGIERQVLLEHGCEPLEVARALNQRLAGEVVYSDAWGNDSSWLALLYDTAGISQHFRLQSLRSIMTEAQTACWHEVKQQVVREYGYRRHRASHDAQILQETFLRTAMLTGGEPSVQGLP